ncbi:hypothetical protein Leryth_021109 [Lithospermum erythrorhizon]|nr:hypothetical protein Leryth_021109 [Lithospermum erythrorhizon]
MSRYIPRQDTGKRFVPLNPTETPRLYHSSAILLPDGRIIVGGSNPHVRYNFTGVMYPTDLSLEEFKPPYMDSVYDHLRPSILSIEGLAVSNVASYGQKFSINFMLPFGQSMDQGGEVRIAMMAPSFTTHSFAMNQRLLELEIIDVQLIVLAMKVTVYAPPTVNLAPPGYYMLFVVHEGIPGKAVWIKMVKT